MTQNEEKMLDELLIEVEDCVTFLRPRVIEKAMVLQAHFLREILGELKLLHSDLAAPIGVYQIRSE